MKYFDDTELVAAGVVIRLLQTGVRKVHVHTWKDKRV